MSVLNWKKKGEFINVFGHSIFVIDSNTLSNTSNNTKDVLVLLHGYPTSSYDYYKVLPDLAQQYRVIMHDHLGFGFSEKPLDYSYSLIEQADIALQLWKQLGLKKVTLCAHDYGTSVATEILARDNMEELTIKIKQLILCNGSMHIELSQLRTIQILLKNKWTGKWVAKLTNYPIFRRNLRNVFFDKRKVSEVELQDMWFQLEYNNGRKVIHLLSNYINERYYFWHRWIGALKESQIPTKIVWARNDPVAVAAIASLLATEIPNNALHWIEDTGHFPMLENPEEWKRYILDK
ncbi:alpha/beta hydrolase [Flavobacteriaceae bacterium S356]|uniref:Alpha/beta hydrolase n=1 Tax=Asprobacillus argus TaxID=3076534 RepID=A0ABU3LF57_9FLAO|nr:alpha/beta hydrolase [Flavobacteriaceae bacterium S356]